ncbi:MAG: diguanylate cyclase [Planctomycetota bacterium]
MSDVFASTGDGAIFSLPQIRHLLRVEFARAQRYGYPLALVLVDFAPVRSALGDGEFEGGAADIVSRLRALVRTSDYLGRIEGDRLLVLLPHTDAQGGTRLVERAREAFSVGGDGGARVGPCTGVASLEQGTVLFFDALLEAAEDALAAELAGGRAAARVL